MVQVLRVERFASEVPVAESYSNNMPIEFNSLLRLALGSVTYVTIHLLQIAINWLVYERYIEHNIQQFIDLCTLANISVWLLSEERYGFYIHGR